MQCKFSHASIHRRLAGKTANIYMPISSQYSGPSCTTLALVKENEMEKRNKYNVRYSILYMFYKIEHREMEREIEKWVAVYTLSFVPNAVSEHTLRHFHKRDVIRELYDDGIWSIEYVWSWLCLYALYTQCCVVYYACVYIHCMHNTYKYNFGRYGFGWLAGWLATYWLILQWTLFACIILTYSICEWARGGGSGGSGSRWSSSSSSVDDNGCYHRRRRRDTIFL